jgi:hypothetical protein
MNDVSPVQPTGCLVQPAESANVWAGIWRDVFE